MCRSRLFTQSGVCVKVILKYQGRRELIDHLCLLGVVKACLVKYSVRLHRGQALIPHESLESGTSLYIFGKGSAGSRTLTLASV